MPVEIDPDVQTALATLAAASTNADGAKSKAATDKATADASQEASLAAQQQKEEAYANFISLVQQKYGPRVVTRAVSPSAATQQCEPHAEDSDCCDCVSIDIAFPKGGSVKLEGLEYFGHETY